MPAWPMRKACEALAGADANNAEALLHAVGKAVAVLYNASGRP
jgi:hypothetical protein